MAFTYIATPTDLFRFNEWGTIQSDTPLGAAIAAMGRPEDFVEASIVDVINWLCGSLNTETHFGDWKNVVPQLEERLNAGTHALFQDPTSGYFVLEPT